MLDYQYGEKIEIKDADLSIEICGVMSASQPLVINYSGEKLYNVTINGKHIVLKASVLEELISSGKIGHPVEEKIEKIIDEAVDEADEADIEEIRGFKKPIEKKNKAGRPKKGA